MEKIMSDIFLPNYEELTKEDGVIYGTHNVVKTVNPTQCYFIATYPDGKVIRGKDIINTGWDVIPDGLSKLQYVLSTGHIIEFPKYKAYKPVIECSFGMDGSRLFHSIQVHCLEHNSIVIDKIILKQDWYSKYNIGDRVLSRINSLPSKFDKAWKFTSLS